MLQESEVSKGPSMKLDSVIAAESRGSRGAVLNAARKLIYGKIFLPQKIAYLQYRGFRRPELLKI